MLKRTFFILSITAFIIFGSTACTPASVAPGASSQGKNATIVLDENPTTGYTWAVSIDREDILNLTNDKYTASKSDSKIAGAGGFHTYVFKAKSPGTAVITFDLGQQWAGGQKGAKTQKYEITVGPDGNIASTKEIQ